MKKIVCIILIIVLMSIIAACGDDMEEAINTESSTQLGNDSNLETQYIEALKSVVNDDVLGFGETISGITLDDRVVTISVDMSTADTSMFGLKDIAETEFSRITDAALNLTEFNELWDSMTIDFGSELGSITKTHEDIVDDGYGPYFNIETDYGWD